MIRSRLLTPNVQVSGQLTAADVYSIAAEGVTVIVNNRPDGEEPGQPSSVEIRAAAVGAGITYIEAPVAGLPGTDAIMLVSQALAQDTKIWMFCRSGMRSTVAWAMAMSKSGAMHPDAIRDIAAGAGYDLSRLPL